MSGMNKQTMTTRYLRNQEILANKMDDELILLSLNQNKYYGFNEVATRIWDLLEKPASKEELAAILLQEYDIERDNCLQEIDHFINDMLGKNLIRIQGN